MNQRIVDDGCWVNGIDDVTSNLKVFISDGCCLLFTSRDERFSSVFDKIVKFERREASLARRMLRTFIGFDEYDESMSEEAEKASQDVLALCAGLPLALAIAGGVREKIAPKKENEQKQNAWADYSREFKSLNQEFLISSWNVIDKPMEDDDASDDYRNLTTIVEISLAILCSRDESFWERFEALSVIRKPQVVPLKMLQKL